VTARGWDFFEEIGISIPNPRSVVRMPIPKDLSPEQLVRLDAAFAELEAEQKAAFEAELKAEEIR
jgi:hypothetical protein